MLYLLCNIHTYIHRDIYTHTHTHTHTQSKSCDTHNIWDERVAGYVI